MGLFEHFPYTNMHELNLSWLLQAMKKLQEDYEAFKVQVEETVEAFRLQMDGWEERIADLEASWAALQAEWVAFRAEISGQMDGLEDRISGLERTWTAYQSAMDAAFNEFEATVTSLISEWDDRISELETSWTNYQATIDSAMQSFEDEIRGAISAMTFQDVSEAFTQNGAVGRMGRQAYQISNMVHGILSFRDGWTGEHDRLVVDVDGLSLPGHGMYYLYRCQLPGYVLETQPFICGWFNSLGPEPKRRSKNYNLTQEPANIVEPKKTKAGGYIINIPDFVKEYLLEYPDYSVLMVFEYVPSDKEV